MASVPRARNDNQLVSDPAFQKAMAELRDYVGASTDAEAVRLALAVAKTGPVIRIFPNNDADDDGA